MGTIGYHRRNARGIRTQYQTKGLILQMLQHEAGHNNRRRCGGANTVFVQSENACGTTQNAHEGLFNNMAMTVSAYFVPVRPVVFWQW